MTMPNHSPEPAWEKWTLGKQKAEISGAVDIVGGAAQLWIVNQQASVPEEWEQMNWPVSI